MYFLVYWLNVTSPRPAAKFKKKGSYMMDAEWMSDIYSGLYIQAFRLFMIGSAAGHI